MAIMKRRIIAAVVGTLLLTLCVPNVYAADRTLTLTIDCQHKARFDKPTRTIHDGGVWTFTVAAGANVTLSNFEWTYPANDPDWGEWVTSQDKKSVIWTAPIGGLNKLGQFPVHCKGKIKCGAGGPGGGGGGGAEEDFSAEWDGVVAPVTIELDHASFGNGNFTMKTDATNPTFASDGTINVRVPEIQKTAGTGIGANPPADLKYDSMSPVCYAWESSPSLSASFNIAPNVTAPGIPVRMRLTATIGTTTLTYNEQALTLQGTTATAGFTTTNKLPKHIDNIGLTLAWEVSFDAGGTWSSIANTSNQLFATAGTPTGSVLTVRRIDMATTAAKDKSPGPDIVDSLWDNCFMWEDFVPGAPNRPVDVNTSWLWSLLDQGGGGECIDNVSSFDCGIKLIGLNPAGNVSFVFPAPQPNPRVVNAALTATVGTKTNESNKRPSGTGQNGHIDNTHNPQGNNVRQFDPVYEGMEVLKYYDGHDVNEYEACYSYNGKYYAGGSKMAPFGNANVVIRQFAQGTYWYYFTLYNPVTHAVQMTLCEQPGPNPDWPIQN